MQQPYAITKEDLGFSRIISIIFRSTWIHFPWIMVGLLALAFFSGTLQAAAPKILQVIIDLLVKGNGWQVQGFWKLLIAYGLCLLGGAIFKFGASKISFYLATQVEDKWRYAALRHYHELPFAWHDQHDSGEVGSRIDKGGSAVFVIIHELIGQNIFVSFLILAIIIVYTIVMYPSFALVLLFPIPLYIIITYIISQKIAAGQAHLNVLSEIANRTLYDGVANVRTVKAFGKEKEETKNYATKWSGYHLYEYGIERLWLIQDFLQSTIEISMRTIVLGYCAYTTYNGSISIGELTLIMSYQQMTFAPLVQLNSLFTRLRRNVKRISHLFEIIAEEDALHDKPNAVNIKPLQKEITVKKMHFEYSGRIAALHGLNLRIPAGKTTALVGRSGAGKSTLALLLMRFYDPEEGSIMWDNTDLRQIKRASLRKKVAWIPQDTSLFNRTIKENIAYGKQNVTQEEVEEAAQLAHAHDFILQTPNGYSSVIGERGVRLSGGQRQRIAIARALLTKPSLLIMDESTSHLDSETEKAISDSIRELHHKTTQLIIAHRLSTILHADQIVVLDKGRIVAVGKHEDLLKNPVYKRLYLMQFHRDE